MRKSAKFIDFYSNLARVLGSPVAGQEHRPSTKTARTPTDKSVWGKIGITGKMFPIIYLGDILGHPKNTSKKYSHVGTFFRIPQNRDLKQGIYDLAWNVAVHVSIFSFQFISSATCSMISYFNFSIFNS